MQINIATRHGHLSEASQEKIRTKVSKLPRFLDRVMAIEVTVDLQHKEELLVEIIASVEHSTDFVAHEKASDLTRAVDGAVQKMEQQLRKYKEKHQDRNHQGAPRHQEAYPPESTT